MQTMNRRNALTLMAFGGLFMAASAGPATAQQRIGACAFSKVSGGRGTANPTQRALGELRTVLRALRYNANLQIYQSNEVQNAAAIPNGYGSGTILYNPRFMNGLARLHPAAPISVVAHEVGHFTPQGGFAPSSYTRELTADYVSGIAMRRIGYDQNAATVALRSMFDRFGSPSHPDTPRRINAMMQGYFSG